MHLKKNDMKDQLSNRINSLPVSATLAMAAKARELKGQGKDIISLSLGEPDFNTPDFIKDAAIQAINENYNSYTPVDGYGELKEAKEQKTDLSKVRMSRSEQAMRKAAENAGRERQKVETFVRSEKKIGRNAPSIVNDHCHRL